MSQVENKTLYIKASQSKQVTNKRIILSDVLDIISLDNDAVKRAGARQNRLRRLSLFPEPLSAEAEKV